jgi:hypothetical protein
MKNVRLVKDTHSRAGAPGFDMRYGWIFSIMLLIAVWAMVTTFFDLCQ